MKINNYLVSYKFNNLLIVIVINILFNIIYVINESNLIIMCRKKRKEICFFFNILGMGRRD